MHPVGSKEAVVESLAQAVLVNRVPEIAIRRLVVLPQRRRRHADLDGWGEVVEDVPLGVENRGAGNVRVDGYAPLDVSTRPKGLS